jgi:uncharacterized protein (TIGR02145 family)
MYIYSPDIIFSFNKNLHKFLPMKANIRLLDLFKSFALIGLLLMISCNKETPPTVSSLPVTVITANSAKSGGHVTDQGSKKVISRGLVWGTQTAPTLEQHTGITVVGFGLGIFTSTMNNLLANTKYYVRAYATSYEGTGYGQEEVFTTLNSSGNPQLPTVTTAGVTNITQTSAMCGGDVLSAGSNPVTGRGVCWGLSPNPTIANDTTVDGTGTGLFVSHLVNLQPNQQYYVRAYATNSSGTAYGNEVTFTSGTSGVASPSVVTSIITSYTANSAVGGGNVIADGGAPVTAKGVCWSPNPAPSLSDPHTNDGTGTGTFVSNIAGLLPNTTYYVKAYATNSAGTGYGTEVSFQTAPALVYPVYDIDGNGYDTVQIGTQVWLKQNLKTSRFSNGNAIPIIISGSAWINSFSSARCWYDNDSAYWGIQYGMLYNWYTINQGSLCPVGWHVPSENEWTSLVAYLGGDSLAGGKLKEAGFVHWDSPNTGATNASGFTGLPGGLRGTLSGTYVNVGKGGNWWSSSGFSTLQASSFALGHQQGVAYIYNSDKQAGFSIRCLKD